MPQSRQNMLLQLLLVGCVVWGAMAFRALHSTRTTTTTRSFERTNHRFSPPPTTTTSYPSPTVSLQATTPGTVSRTTQTAIQPVSWIQSISLKDDYALALIELFRDWHVNEENDDDDDDDDDEDDDDNRRSPNDALAFLFVSPPWASNLGEITRKAQGLLGDDTQLVCVVGGGVVGEGKELEDGSKPIMSFFGGKLPRGSSVRLEGIANNDKKKKKNSQSIDKHAMATTTTTMTTNLPFFATEAPKSPRKSKERDLAGPHSHIIFADPFFRDIQSVLDECDHAYRGAVVAGGVSVATNNKRQPTLAIGSRVLQAGSLIRASFSGNLGLQVVVSTGCRPIGPTYRVTSVNGPAVVELDSVRAVDQLEAAIESGCTQEDQALIRSKGIRGVLGGIFQSDGDDEIVEQYRIEETTGQYETTEENQSQEKTAPDQKQLQGLSPEDFVLRQVTGFQPKSGSILVCGRPQVQRGDFFRFHVRSALSARKDWQKVLRRAKAERLFMGPRQAGRALGALQVSCMARGTELFEEQDVDLRHAQSLLENSGTPNGEIPQVAGFFASAEIGPSSNSLRMGAADGDAQPPQKSFLHGFATVVALLCDYSAHDDQHNSNIIDTSVEVGGIIEDARNSTTVWA